MDTLEKPSTTTSDKHVKIVVAEGRVTLDELHKALDQAISHMVRGGCNCGLTGFDISFLRGDPALNEQLGKIKNVQGGFVTQG